MDTLQDIRDLAHEMNDRDLYDISYIVYTWFIHRAIREVRCCARWKDTKTGGLWVASSAGAWSAQHPACRVCMSTYPCTRNGSRTTYAPTNCFRRQTTIIESDFPWAKRDRLSSLRRSNPPHVPSSHIYYYTKIVSAL